MVGHIPINLGGGWHCLLHVLRLLLCADIFRFIINMGLAKLCVCVCGHEEPLILMEQVAVAHSPLFCLVFDATRRCVSLKAVKLWGGVKVRDRSLL